MFDKTERGFFAGTDVLAIVNRLGSALHRAEATMQQTAPAIWVAKGWRSSWSMVPRVTITASPTPRGFMLDVRVNAEVEPGGAVALVLCWFFFFPAAIILAVLAHQDFVKRQSELFQLMHAEIRHLMIEPNFPPPLAGGAPPNWPR